MSKKVREKLIYKQVYKKDAVWLPPSEFEVTAEMIMGIDSGIVERDGERHEFETLRFYYKQDASHPGGGKG